MIKPWRWVQVSKKEGLRRAEWELLDGQDRNRATIWENEPGKRYTWHTWNERGTGGENSEAPTLVAAKNEAVAAIVRQGWAPGGWKVQWSTS